MHYKDRRNVIRDSRGKYPLTQKKYNRVLPGSTVNNIFIIFAYYK